MVPGTRYHGTTWYLRTMVPPIIHNNNTYGCKLFLEAKHVIVGERAESRAIVNPVNLCH